MHNDNSMVPRGSQQSDIAFEEERDSNEQMYKKQFKEGYDIYDEDYVKWLMAKHPNDVPSERLTEVSTSSVVPPPLQPDESTACIRILLE